MTRLMAETCPYLSQSGEGTGFCRLAENGVRYVTGEYEKLQRAAWNFLQHDTEENRRRLYELASAARYFGARFDGEA